VSTAPPLCNSPSQELSTSGQCETESLEFQPLEPCCAVQTVVDENDPCAVSATGELCRDVTVSNPSCPPDSQFFCNNENMQLQIDLEVTTNEDSCCRTCTCYGDPHCESFDGSFDTWILCDSRQYRNSKGICTIDHDTCLTQKDHLGRTCEWKGPVNNKGWIVGLQGSQCQFQIDDDLGNAPRMDMYSFKGFSVVNVLGERGIIQAVYITDSSGLYILDADDCFADAGIRNPWRAAPGEDAAPEDPSWLPKSWLWAPLEGGDILWSTQRLPSKIDVNIRCTRTVQRDAGRTRYGPPRLNIEQLVEPFEERQNAGGFCLEGEITDKKGSTEWTEEIERTGICDKTDSMLAIGKVLCNKNLKPAGVEACKANWCKSVRPDWEQCVSDIGEYGWDKTYCSSQTMLTQDPAECVFGRGNCGKCLNDIGDFGWQDAYDSWDGSITVADSECTEAADLPPSLVGCQQGLSIQYESSPGFWTTYKAVPSTVRLCEDKLTFSSVEDPQLFANKIRIEQCSLPPTCLTNKCARTSGWNAAFHYEAESNPYSDAVDLIESGDLICDPAKWPSADPLSCLGSNPPAMCPCP